MAERTKVYLSNLALENGILEKYVDDVLSQDQFLKVYDNDSDISTSSIVDHMYVHATAEGAVAAGERMRNAEMLKLQTRMRELYEHEIKVIRG